MRTSRTAAHGSRSRLGRWLRRVLLAVTGLVTVAVVLVLVLAHSLDHPSVKARVQALVSSATGIDVDYRSIRLRLLGGIEIEDLVVRSPAPFRAVAPELARVGKLDAAWSTALFTGRGRRVDHVALSDVALTLAIDETGRTSLDAVGPAPAEPAPPAEPPTPLSHRAGDLLALAPLIPAVDVRGLSLTLVRTAPDEIERTTVRGLSLRVAPESAGGRSHLRASLGAPASPLDVTAEHRIADEPARNGRARLWFEADATAEDLTAKLDLEVVEQTFVDELDAKRLLYAEVRAHFDPAAKKTTVSVDDARVADDIATATARIDLPDEGAPIVQRSEGQIDFVRLLAVVPPGLVPVRAKLTSGQARFRIGALALDALPHLHDGAKVEIDAELAGVNVVPEEGAGIDVASAKITARIEPAGGVSLRAHASVGLDGVRLPAGRADGLRLEAEAAQSSTGELSGTATLAFADIETNGSTRIAARDGKLELRAGGLVVPQGTPLATRGDVKLAAEVAALDVRTRAARGALDRVALTAHSKLEGGAPWALDVDLRTVLLRVWSSDGRALARAPTHLAVKAAELRPEAKEPISSSGNAHVVVDAGDIHLQLDATKSRDALEFELASQASSLEAARPLLPPDLAERLPVSRMALAMRSRGRVGALSAAAPSLEQHTELRVDRPAFDRASARSLALVVDSKGTALRQEIDGDLHLDGLALEGASPSDDRIVFGASFDREAPSLRVRIEASGRAKAKLAAALAFDRSRRAVTYDAEGGLTGLEPLAPLVSAAAPALGGLDLSRLEVTGSAHGALVGVVSAIDRDGGVRLEPAPSRTAGLDGTFALDAKHVAWRGGSASASTSAIALRADLRTTGDRRTVEGRVDVDDLQLANGRHEYAAKGLGDRLSVTLEGDLADPIVESKHEVAVRQLDQDVIPIYRIEDATLAVDVRRTRDGVVHVSKLEMTNGAGGTSFALRGALDPSEYQRRLSLRGELRQDLARLSNAPNGPFSARGNADVALRIESPDFATFRTIADVRVTSADVRLPSAGITVEGADGAVPITATVRIGPDGPRLLREEYDNPYSALRFADQHPLLSRSSFISIRRLLLPQVTISPLVGNLQIEHNIVSLRQFEMGIRGGRVTGQCALDWNGDKSTLDMHVRADGVQSSHGEPFTGSAALVVSAAEHSIEGRADVLQIGKRHLLDLLDLQDPFHADPGINKIRSALFFGYPDRVRATFDHGFANVHVTFGGLAKLVSVGDLRGIPIGPLIDQLISPVLTAKGEP